MLSTIRKFWQAQDFEAVAKVQTLGAAGNFNLNGNLATSSTSTIDFSKTGRDMARQVAITATITDVHTANFVVTGNQNGTVVTSSVTGVFGGTTVYTNESYDIVTSVHVDRAVANVEIGSGLSGYFSLYSLPIAGSTSFSLNAGTSPFALGFNANGVSYKVYQSLDNLVKNGETYESLINSGALILLDNPRDPGTKIDGLTATEVYQFTGVYYNLLVAITGTNNTSTLETKFLQL